MGASKVNDELIQLLLNKGISESDYTLTTTLTFADLLWDPDLTRAEVMELPLAVIADSKRNQHRIVLQRIRNEIRYCLYTNRDPRTHNKVEYEMGVVENVTRMVELIVEFLDHELRPDELSTVRSLR